MTDRRRSRQMAVSAQHPNSCAMQCCECNLPHQTRSPAAIPPFHDLFPIPSSLSSRPHHVDVLYRRLLIIASIPPARKMVSLFSGIPAHLPSATMHCRPLNASSSRHSSSARMCACGLSSGRTRAYKDRPLAMLMNLHIFVLWHLHLHSYVVLLLLHEAHHGSEVLASGLWSNKGWAWEVQLTYAHFSSDPAATGPRREMLSDGS